MSQPIRSVGSLFQGLKDKKKEMRTIAGTVAIVLLALAYTWIQRWLQVFGPFRETKTRNSNRCTPIEGTYGCEDIQVVGDYAYMACAEPAVRQKWFPPLLKFDETESRNDKAFVYSFKDKTLKELHTSHFEGDFRTHGISVIPAHAKYRVYIALVNHRRSRSCVSLFEHRLGTSEIVHYETVCDPLIYNPNDVALVSKHSFYVTNYMSPSKSQLNHYWEMATQRRWNNIVFRGEDGKSNVVATGLSGANGIILSPNQQYVYAVSTFRGEIAVYERQGEHLKEIDTVKVNFLPDNLSVDPATGVVYITGHDNVQHARKYFMSNGKFRSPSVVVKMFNNTASGSAYGTELIFSDDGSKASGSTIAAVHHDSKSLLIGGIYQKNVLLCKNII